MMEEEVKKQLKWRLSEKPTVDGLEKLINLGIITKEEAKEILLAEDEVSNKTFKDLEKEIELLRELVLDIAKRDKQTTEIIYKYIDNTPYHPWKSPYIYTWMSSGNTSVNNLAMKYTSAAQYKAGDTISLSSQTQAINKSF